MFSDEGRPAPDPFQADRAAIAGLVMDLRAQGISDHRVLKAMEEVPRRLFVSAQYRDRAYQDRALPIECGQTISAPSVVALMLQVMELRPEHKVLEVGCGSGYAAAILSRLVTQVVALDRYRTLVDLAGQRFATLRLTNVTAVVADGCEGFARHAPYDRILVSAAGEEVPPALIDQLADNGVLVAPVGTRADQQLLRIRRAGRDVTRESIASVRFVPLVPGVASRL